MPTVSIESRVCKLTNITSVETEMIKDINADKVLLYFPILHVSWKT